MAARRSSLPSLVLLLAMPVLACAGGARAAPATASAIDHALAEAVVSEARALEAANPWPDALFGPVLLVDPASRDVVASEADAGGRLRAAGELYVGSLPRDVIVANTATSWAGRRWTMLRWPLPSGTFARRILLGHELFHRLGPGLGLPMASPENGHLDRAAGRLWLRLELRALTRALVSSGAARRAALADALAFRARRHDAFPAAAGEERALELNEGLAEYTGIHVALPAAGRAGWAAQQIESREVQAAHDGISRSFAYATGPAYGLLLDEADPGWTLRIDATCDLAALAADAYGIEAGTPLAARARSRMDAYDGARLERQEQQREAAREAEETAASRRYVEGPVLTLPVDESFRYGFDPGAVTTMDGLGRVLSGAEVQAGWGRLDVTGGVLMRRGPGGGIVAVVVPAPDEPAARPLTGDGWTLELDDAWTLVPGEREGDLVVRRAP